MRRRLRDSLIHLTAGSLALGILAAPGATAQPAAAQTVETVTVAETVVPYGSRWGQYVGTPSATWRTDSGWPVSSAPFGRGRDVQQVNTILPQAGTQQPLATYFRRQLDLSSDLPEAMRIVTWADDGVIVYINGVEVGRSNIAPGSLKSVVYATKAPSSRSARKLPVAFDIPVELLHTGRNTIAVHVAANWRQSPNVSFDAKLTRLDVLPAAAPVPDPTEPATPSPSPTPGETATPTVSPTPTPSPTATPEPTAAPTPTTQPAPAPAPAPAPPSGPGVQLGWGAPVFQDDFSYRDPSTGSPSVDPSKWNVRGRSDLGLLFDAAVPDPSQVTVDKGGVLHIRADWLDAPVTRPAGQSGPTDLWHQTGYLDQRRLQSDDVAMAQPYGRWEIRAKTPTGPNTLGSLAAFWLRNQQSGEIDIVEAWGYDEAAVRDQRIDTATTTVHTHTATPSENKKYIWHHEDFGAATPVWDDFHTYAFELTPTYAAIWFDGKEITRVTPATHPNLWDSRYFGSPLHMRLNLHVGPSVQYWGLPNPNDKASTQNLDFQVDYVRVWAYDSN